MLPAARSLAADRSRAAHNNTMEELRGLLPASSFQKLAEMEEEAEERHLVLLKERDAQREMELSREQKIAIRHRAMNRREQVALDALVESKIWPGHNETGRGRLYRRDLSGFCAAPSWIVGVGSVWPRQSHIDVAQATGMQMKGRPTPGHMYYRSPSSPAGLHLRASSASSASRRAAGSMSLPTLRPPRSAPHTPKTFM
eukprot:7377184-Prymnesium_polylepis.1